VRPGRMRNGASWSADRCGVLVSVGCRDGTRAGFCCLPMSSRWLRNEARATCGGLRRLRARDAGVLGFPSDPS